MIAERPPPRAVALGYAVMLALEVMSHAPGARADFMPPRGHVDSRVRSAAYEADEVYRLRGFTGYQIDLQFEAGETFVGLGAGDLEGLSYFGQDNHLFLKPKAARVATNLTVLTNRRHYQFEYVAAAAPPDPKDLDVIYVLRFVYPAVPPGAAEAAAKQIDAELDGAAMERRQNFNYWYCGGADLRPIAASDDGIRTRLRFAANADLPALFVRGDDDSESLLNFSMDKGDVIVHRVARRFVLRRGTRVGCIVNEGFVGGGARLDSGTVTPAVERHTRGDLHEQ